MARDALLTLVTDTPMPPPLRRCRACLRVSRWHKAVCQGCGSPNLALWIDEQVPPQSQQAMKPKRPSPGLWAHRFSQGLTRPNHADHPADKHPGYRGKVVA